MVMVSSIIVACAEDGGIGIDGKMPWTRFPEDMARFRAITAGSTLIMGRRTWDSLPRRPLPGRHNIVVSSKPEIGDVSHVPHPDTVAGRACYIGGVGIFEEALDFVDVVHMTSVCKTYKGCDCFFPLDKMKRLFRLDPRSTQDYAYSDAIGAKYRFETWTRT